jgi:hypothetical protein
LLYRADCAPFAEGGEFVPDERLLTTVNDKPHGLGVALPAGGIAVFEPSVYGPLLVGEERLRDSASGQDVEIELGRSDQVQVSCRRMSDFDPAAEPRKWTEMQLELTNALASPIQVRIRAGSSADWEVQRSGKVDVKDGIQVIEVTVPANSERKFRWHARPAESFESAKHAKNPHISAPNEKISFHSCSTGTNPIHQPSEDNGDTALGKRRRSCDGCQSQAGRR